jgi:hypothetical protein
MLRAQDCLLGDARRVVTHTNRVKTASYSHGRISKSAIAMGSLPCDVRKPRNSEPVGLHVLFMFRIRAAPQNSGKRPVGATKYKRTATCDPKVLDYVSFLGRPAERHKRGSTCPTCPDGA